MLASLRPLLRPAGSGARSALSTPTTFAQSQTRNATRINRPKRPYLHDQIVILSDGSSYKQLTTSPFGIIRITNDSHNAPLFNPHIKELQNVEKDDAGRLKGFREKFGDLNF